MIMLAKEMPSRKFVRTFFFPIVNFLCRMLLLVRQTSRDSRLSYCMYGHGTMGRLPGFSFGSIHLPNFHLSIIVFFLPFSFLFLISFSFPFSLSLLLCLALFLSIFFSRSSFCSSFCPFVQSYVLLFPSLFPS